jgi:hypothetical protein
VENLEGYRERIGIGRIYKAENMSEVQVGSGENANGDKRPGNNVRNTQQGRKRDWCLVSLSTTPR